MCTDKISGNEDKCLKDQLRDAKMIVGKEKSEMDQFKTTISRREKCLKTMSKSYYQRAMKLLIKKEARNHKTICRKY